MPSNTAVSSTHRSCLQINRPPEDAGTRNPVKQQGALSGKTVTQAKASQADEMHGMSARFSASSFKIHAGELKGSALMARLEGTRKEVREKAQREYFGVLYKSLCAGIKPEICAANVENVCGAKSGGASPSWSLGELIKNAKASFPPPSHIVIPDTAQGLVKIIQVFTRGGLYETKWSSFVSLADSKMPEERVVLNRGGDPEIASKEEESPAIKKLSNMAAWSAFNRAAEKQYPKISFSWTDYALGEEGELDLTPKRISKFKQEMQEMQQQDIQKLQAVFDRESALVEKLCKKMGDNSLTERSTVKLIFECTAKGGDLDRIVHLLSEQPGLSSLKDKRLNTSELVRMLSNISKMSNMQRIDKCEDEAVKRIQLQQEGGRCKVENLVKVIRHAVKNGGTLISLQQKATALPGMEELGDRVISSEKDLAHALVELAPKPSLNTHRNIMPIT